MENFKEFVMNAIGSNGFQSTATAAGYINPDVWNTQVLRHVEDTIIVSRYAKVYNDLLGAPGDTLNVTVNSAPAAAAAVLESNDVTIAAYAVTQVIFTPTEYAFAYQLSDKEARRAFYDVASDMTRKIGYALALKRDTDAISELQTTAGNTVTANGVLSSLITTSDKIDYDDIVNAMTEIRKDKLVPRILIVSPGQLGHLMQNAAFRDASQYGGRETVLGGELKQIAGLTVVYSTLITPASSKSKAIMLGMDLSGESPFGFCIKANPAIRSQRFELGRYTDFVGVEEWDVATLRANGICTIESYDA
jgi:N4-gp56 family major capsid protein